MQHSTCIMRYYLYYLKNKFYREQIKTLKQAIETAAKDNDLRWFLSLTDQSIITLIKNWIHYANAEDKSYKKHKESIKNVCNNVA